MMVRQLYLMMYNGICGEYKHRFQQPSELLDSQDILSTPKFSPVIAQILINFRIP